MKTAAFFTSLLATFSIQAATPIGGWYSSLFGGYTYVPGNIDSTHYGLTRTHVQYESGFDGGGNIGFKSAPMRYELEISYLKVNTKHFNINGVKQIPASGYNQGVFGLANVYYDFYKFPGLIQPFIGIGMGYGWVQAILDSTGSAGPTSFNASGSTFTYQGNLGLTFNFAENYALTLGYRYLTTLNVTQFGKRFQANVANLGATYRFDGNDYK